ncbi:competence/damage-inducible protein A [bacterium K02(2017)]|nr:competence/damage-inducible protein A [bacterium K02(2017)]
MIVEIISIGDEILAGNILDTNKQYISDSFWQLGFKVKYHVSVCDDEGDIGDALLLAAKRADVVICTGGLGPTADDFTVEVAAKTFKVKLVENEMVLNSLISLLEKKGRKLCENNRKQARVFEKGKAFLNKVGTAPCVNYCFKGTDFYFLPGVPREMKSLLNESVLPNILSSRVSQYHFKTKFLKTFGCPESELDNKLKDLWRDRTFIDKARIGFRCHLPEVTIKVSVWDKNESEAQNQLGSVVKKIYDRVGEFIYSEDKRESLESLLIKKLSENNKTLATAESCTGGLIAKRLTDISGASRVYLGGVVSYANSVKEDVLNVSQDIINKYGAVSRECAEAMVKGIKHQTKADYCAAVTGIAGPDGGSKEKPVGTVHVALIKNGELSHQKLFLPYPREMFRMIVSSVILKAFLDE